MLKIKFISEKPNLFYKNSISKEIQAIKPNQISTHSNQITFPQNLSELNIFRWVLQIFLRVGKSASVFLKILHFYCGNTVAHFRV